MCHSIVASVLVALGLSGIPAFAQIPEDVAKASADLAARQAEAIARAQQKVAEEAARKQEAFERELARVIPLDVHVVLTRYQGEKKVGSFPYQLSVNAIHSVKERPVVTSVRMGARVPLATMAPPTVDGKPVTGMLQMHPVSYEEIGTDIDAWAKFLEGGDAFDVGITVADRSVYMPSDDSQRSPVETLPVVRTFRATNQMVLKDGQTKQFTLATDRVSGETLRVDVTLKVAK